MKRKGALRNPVFKYTIMLGPIQYVGDIAPYDGFSILYNLHFIVHIPYQLPILL